MERSTGQEPEIPARARPHQNTAVSPMRGAKGNRRRRDTDFPELPGPEDRISPNSGKICSHGGGGLSNWSKGALVEATDSQKG